MIFSKVQFVRSFMVQNRKMSMQDLKQIFLKSVEAVQPETLIKNEVGLSSVASRLVVRGESFALRKKCYMVGFGKAVLGMATEMESILGDHLERALVSVPVGIFETHRTAATSQIEYMEGAENNLPDENALRASQKIKDLVEGLAEDDLLIVLISGGGSALLPLPAPPITLQEKLELIKLLSRRGATINELNCVRKKISLLKGGGLAQLAYPCKIISLILSDIVGDPLELIASAPTIPDTEPPQKGVEILRKYNLIDSVPESVRHVLEQGKASRELKIINGEYEHVRNYIIGNNTLAARAAEDESKRRGYQSLVVSTKIEGDVEKIAKTYAKLAATIDDVKQGRVSKDDLGKFLKDELAVRDDLLERLAAINIDSNICIIFAGEPTVLVRGKGKGGRNQQLALAFSSEIFKLGRDCSNIFFLSCGTDGIDGPTDAAGAISPTSHQGELDIKFVDDCLEKNDAYAFFESWNRGENLVKIGHTGTNVMDLHLLIIRKK